MTDASAFDVLRKPIAPIDLSGSYDFEQILIRGVSLSVDRDARTRIAAAAEVSRLGDAGASAIPHLIAMLAQDRISDVSRDIVAAFVSGGATTSDGHRAENMARFAEADLACHVAASGALAKIGTAAIPALMEALRSAVPNARIGAANALGQLGVSAVDALPLLESLARTDPADPVRKAAAEAVKQLEPHRQ